MHPAMTRTAAPGRRTVLGLVVGLAVTLGACSSTPGPAPNALPVLSVTSATGSTTTPPVAPADAEFRKKAPAPGPEVVFVPPKIEEARLANGMRVLLVERHELPIVGVSVVLDRGAAEARPGVGGFTGAMLFSGTKTRSALQISDEMGKLGASYGAWADYDAVGLRLQALTPKVGAALTILADAAQNPAFDPDEIKRERSRRLTALDQENDSPGRILSNTVARVLYPGAHPYGTSILGTREALTNITRADLQRFHEQVFAPQHATIAFAGDITKAQAVAEAERVFGAWKGKPRPATPPAEPPPPDAKAPRVILIDRPDATQSSVAVALPGVPRTSKDFDAITLMNTILGGQFSSRLNLNLREAHGYTYGARSGFEFRQGPGPFTASSALFRESTAAGAREILSEIDKMRTGLVTEEELADAKTNVIRQLPARFETASDTAGTLGALAVYGLPLDEFATRTARIQRITREDVKRVAETYLRKDRIRLVVVGDAATVEQGLKELGLGPIEVKRAPAKAAKPKIPIAPAKPVEAPGR